MRELEECLILKKEIDEIDEKIYEIRVRILSAKNQIITGMPRGGSAENAIEKYLLEVEYQMQKKDNLLERQAKLWHKALKKLPKIQPQEKYLLQLRFIRGLSWKKCEAEMNIAYGNWNSNKIFRIYRKLFKNY